MASGARSTLADVETFLSALFEPGDVVEVRILPARIQKFAPSYFKIVEEFDALRRVSENGHSVYFGANPRTGSDGTARGVVMARCVFVDFDGVPPQVAMDRINEAGLPEPTCLIDSGHGTHAWWRLVEPCTDLAAWTLMQKRLALALRSDPAVHDAPRIMRMPGTLNAKREPFVECVVVSASSGYKTPWAELDAALPPWSESAAKAVEDERRAVVGQVGKPSYATVEFLSMGAPFGTINARLFAAACDLCGLGWDRAAAERMLLKAAAIGAPLDEKKSIGTIDSAWGKHRTPARPAEMPDSWSAVPDSDATPNIASATPAVVAQKPSKSLSVSPNGETSSFGSDWIRDTNTNPKALIGNVVQVKYQTEDNETKTALRVVPIEKIQESISDLTGGWPRMAGGELFVPGEMPRAGTIPNPGSITRIGDTNELFSWIHGISSPLWHAKVATGADKTLRVPVTKSEFFEWVKQNPRRFYDSAELVPHEPPADGCWYVPCSLPDDGGAALAEVVRRLNADTPADRVILLAKILTGAWGGACGARPAFVITSTYGRGSGKTTTAEIAATIWGCALRCNPKDDWDKVMGRLLSEQSAAGRYLLLDNLKGRVDSEKLDQVLTAPKFEGWKPYVGQATRPNRVTTVITSNTPRLSADLAARAVIVRIGPPKWSDSGFARWAEEFIPANRPAIIAACLKILRDAPAMEIAPDACDRWNRWQRAVLGAAWWSATGGVPALEAVWGADGVPGVDGLSGLCREIIARREGVDDDAASAEEWGGVIRQAIQAAGYDPDKHSAFLTNKGMVQIIQDSEVTDMGRNGVLGWLSGIAGSGELSPLKKHRHKMLHWGWSWCAGGLGDRGFDTVIDGSPRGQRGGAPEHRSGPVVTSDPDNLPI